MKLWFLCVALLSGTFGADPKPSSEFYDILGSGKREWRLVFKGSAGAGTSMFTAYKGKITYADPQGCNPADWQTKCKRHYRNDDAMANWARVEKVLLGVVQDGVIVKTVVFDGTNSNNMNWMNKNRFLDSCWEDMKKTNTNFFSIRGDAKHHRRFFINNKSGGCPNAVGWLEVVDTATPVCPWEKKIPEGQTFECPLIKYSPNPKRTNWRLGNSMNADALVVFIKYKPAGGLADEYFDVLATGKKEWRLVFRGTANVNSSVFAAYQDGSNIPHKVDPGCKTTNWRSQCRSHYRNSKALDNWTRSNVKEVMIGIVDNGALVKTAIFNGAGTDSLSWFDSPRLIKSCWGDLNKRGNNFFSIAGDAGLKRRFFLSHKYGGCPGDKLWMVAVDRPDPPCKWEKSKSFPTFLYSAGAKMQNANSHVQVRSADAIVIFVKYLR